MRYNQLKSKMIHQANQTNTPILGEFELTSVCNFKCSMCYVHQEKNALTTKQWKYVFDQAVENGLMFALITGGEATTRSDFIELYEYLYDKGVKITVYSNGSKITDEIIQCFQKRPPEFVAISLYGATNETYQSIAKIDKGFDKVLRGIDKLIEGNINLSLRTLPLEEIYDELDLIIEIAKSRNLICSYVNYIAVEDGSVLPNRLNPKELVLFEQKLQNAFQLKQVEQGSCDDELHTCSALRSGYFIDHLGNMSPCALAYKPKRSIIDYDFLESFHLLRDEMKEIDYPSTCFGCESLSSCTSCYAKRLYETSIGCNQYLKEYATIKGDSDEML